MKIALVILHADPARGGAEVYTHRLARDLSREGHDVKLLASTFGADIEREFHVPISADGSSRTKKYQQFLNSLDTHLDQTDYDIVHAMLPVRRCDLYHPHAGVAGLVSKWKLNDLFNPRRFVFANVERQLLTGDKPPIVLSLSAYIDQQFATAYPGRELRIERLFNAVDLDRFPYRKPLNSPMSNMLMVAQDFDRKGLKYAMHAMAASGVERLALTVVGRDAPGRYERLARKLGIDDRVHFAGATSNIVDYYQKADFFILPTKHDPCSLVVLEALASGLPVISTKQNGACDVMRDARHGFVVDRADDIPTLTAAIRQLCDPDIRASMALACGTLRPKLSSAHHLTRLLELYATVAR